MSSIEVPTRADAKALRRRLNSRLLPTPHRDAGAYLPRGLLERWPVGGRQAVRVVLEDVEDPTGDFTHRLKVAEDLTP